MLEGTVVEFRFRIGHHLLLYMLIVSNIEATYALAAVFLAQTFLLCDVSMQTKNQMHEKKNKMK